MTPRPALTTEREVLKRAIHERDTVKEALRVASETAAKAKELLRAAQAKLAAFGDVNDEILKHRAASYKSAAQGGPKPTLSLPEELLRRSRDRDDAASAVAAVQAAHASLAGELAAAESALHKAESKVSEKASEVLAAGAAEPGRALTEIWNEMWSTIDALNALRLALRVKVPADIVRTLQSFEAMDHRQFPGGRNAALATAAQHWKAYHAALCADADATAPDSIDGDGDASSAAVVERVA
jgi:hypothetical protein